MNAVPATKFLVPAPVMPVSSHVDSVIRDHYQVEGSWWDGAPAARAYVFLGGLVGLDRVDRYPEKIAHAKTPRAAAIATTTMMMSTIVFRCSRKGLNPTPGR